MNNKISAGTIATIYSGIRQAALQGATLVLAVCLLATTSVQADEPTTVVFTTEEDILGDIPVVLSATRLSQPKSDAPAAITVIDRAMIEASGIRNVPELLRLVPGFQVGYDYGSLLAPQQSPVTYHGYSDAFSRKMQVLIDGRSVYEPFLGGVRWSELGLMIDDIDRIEVVRGPNGASYGSNAVLGAINIITRHPSQEQGGGTVGVDYDSSSLRQGLYRYSNSSQKYSYRLTTFYSEDSGFDGRNDSKNTTGFSYRAEQKLSDTDSVDYYVGLNQGMRQLGDDPAPAEYPYHDGFINNHYQQVKWTRRKSSDDEISLQLYHYYSQFDNFYTATTTTPIPANTDFNASAQTNRWDMEYQRVRSLGKSQRLVWGAGARLDDANAPGWLGTNDWVQNIVLRVFANHEWRPSPRWTVNTGALVENSTVAETTFSPRLAANYHPTPADTLRIAVSQGFRNPALFEENADTWVWLGNIPGGFRVNYFYSDGSVKAAQVTNYELGYLRESLGQKLSLDAKLFLMQFRGSIAYPGGGAGGYQYTYVNGGDSDIYGAEFQLKMKPTDRTQATISYAYARHHGWYISVLPSTMGTSDQTTPNHTFSLLIDHRLNDNWSAGLFYHFVSDMAWFSGDQTNDYHIVNVRLGRKFILGGKQGSIEIVGQNLAGDYFDFSNKVISKQKIFVGVRVPL